MQRTGSKSPPPNPTQSQHRCSEHMPHSPSPAGAPGAQRHTLGRWSLALSFPHLMCYMLSDAFRELIRRHLSLSFSGFHTLPWISYIPARRPHSRAFHPSIPPFLGSSYSKTLPLTDTPIPRSLIHKALLPAPPLNSQGSLWGHHHRWGL